VSAAGCDKSPMNPESDPRAAALFALVGDHLQPALFAWLMQGLEELEQTDFGELEPIDVVAPFARSVVR
jgi:hypothetical protein